MSQDDQIRFSRERYYTYRAGGEWRLIDIREFPASAISNTGFARIANDTDPRPDYPARAIQAVGYELADESYQCGMLKAAIHEAVQRTDVTEHWEFVVVVYVNWTSVRRFIFISDFPSLMELLPTLLAIQSTSEIERHHMEVEGKEK